MPGAEASGSRLGDRAFLVAVAVAIVPILVAAIRAVADDWAPIGDDAIAAIRAHDVFAGPVPLLGLWSSATLSAGVDLNHPGPLLYDALALPVTVFGHATGTALGMAVINALAVVGIAVFARRQGGAVLGITAVLIAAVLSWTAGSEALYVPWQAHAMILPFLLFMVLVWSVACGDLVALPWAAGVGSFVLQTHLSYTVLVPALGAVAVVAFVVRARSQTVTRGTVRKTGIITAAVVLLCWIQPVIDQLTGTGNLGHLLESGGGDADRAGFGYGARLLATVVGVPPWWFRPSFQDSFVRLEGWRAPSPAAAAISLLAVATLLGVCWWVARRGATASAARRRSSRRSVWARVS